VFSVAVAASHPENDEAIVLPSMTLLVSAMYPKESPRILFHPAFSRFEWLGDVRSLFKRMVGQLKHPMTITQLIDTYLVAAAPYTRHETAVSASATTNTMTT